MELSKWVKAARTHKRMTQTQLGDKLHVTKGNVSAWENGHHEPSFGQLQTISEVTGYPLLQHDVAELEAVAFSAAPAPPPPPRDFHDRHEVSDSDWGVLMDVKLVLTPRELAEIRDRAEHVRQQQGQVWREVTIEAVAVKKPAHKRASQPAPPMREQLLTGRSDTPRGRKGRP